MSLTEPDDVRPRVVVLLAAARGTDTLAAALRSARTALPSDAGLRVGVRHDQDPMAAMMGERGESEPVDGVVEVTLPEGTALMECAAAVDGLVERMDGAVDPSRSAAIAGPCYRFLHADGAVMIALAARRAPGTTMNELTDWWLHRHGPLALGIVSPVPLAYEQLHGDAEASRAAARAAGVAETAYDMFDTIAAATLEELQASVSDPEVGAKLFEDEVGHVDHSSFRGAIQRLL